MVRQRRLLVWILVGLLCGVRHGGAQGRSALEVTLLHQGVQPAHITVGDRAVYEVRVAIPDGYSIEVQPQVPADPLVELEGGPFEIETVSSDHRAIVRIPFRIFRPGLHNLPPLTLTAIAPTAPQAMFQIPPYPVKVASVLPNESQDILDIQSPPPFATSSAPLLVWSVVVGSVMLLSGAIVLEVLRRRNARQEPNEQHVSPWERALRSLELFGGSGTAVGEDAETFYTRLADILRQYVGERYEIPSESLSTKELLQGVAREVDEEALELIRHCLETCDLVKFARYRPPQRAAPLHLQEARQFILSTSASSAAMPE